MKPREGRRLSDEHRAGGPRLSFWREAQSNSGAGLEGDCGPDWRWCVVDPQGNKHTLGNQVIEHRDGTITVVGHVADIAPTQHLGWWIERSVWSDASPPTRAPMVKDTTPPGEVELRRAIAEERMRIGAAPPEPDVKVVRETRR